MTYLAIAVLAGLIVAGLRWRDRAVDRATYAAILRLVPDDNVIDLADRFRQRSLTCPVSQNDHSPIVLGTRNWRHWFRRRYVLYCIRCDRDIGEYTTRFGADRTAAEMVRRRLERLDDMMDG